MKLLLPVAVFAAAVAPPPPVYGALIGGSYNSPTRPRLQYFDGPETMAIDTWDKANDFCHSRGGIMARWSEWCAKRSRPTDWRERKPRGGVKSTEQWVPVRRESGGPANNYILVGPLNGTDYSGICRDWVGMYGDGRHGGRHTYEWMVRQELFCGVPENCEGNKCLMDCPATAPKGFYPDPNDCRSYCYCAGEGKVSWYEAVNITGYVWDPWCKDSKSLYGNNSDPLGGMTGGCANQEWYLADKSYCTPATRRKLRVAAADSTTTSSVTSRKLYETGPDWGQSDDKPPFETNAILCSIKGRMPKNLPTTCGEIWGDPHIVTYDHLAYDCQGSGDFVLSKSLDSGFELQGRFKRLENIGSASIMTGFALKTGRDDPLLEVYLGDENHHNECGNTHYINGTVVNVVVRNREWGTYATGTEKIHYFPSRDGAFFVYPETGITIRYTRKMSKVFGCYYNIQFCADDTIANETLVGLMGSPDGNKTNDFMIPSGYDYTSQDTSMMPSEEGLPNNGLIHWKDGYDYCTSNWCIRDNADSILENAPPTATDQCDLPYDPSLEEAVNRAPKEVQDICKGHLECLVECTAGDSTDCTDSKDMIRSLESQRPDYTPFVVNASSFGDPHFQTWIGNQFDFHGGCDLVLIKNTDFAYGLGLEVHVRTKIQSLWSHIEAAAIRIGENILEITGGQDRITFWLNGIITEEMETGDEALGDFPIRFKRINGHQSQTRLDLGNGNALSVETFKKFVRVNIKVQHAADFAGSYGMLGSFPAGQMVARDGATIIEDANEFGQEWQVLDTEPQLFHSRSTVQPPEKCTMPNESEARDSRRRLGESAVTEEDARDACAGVSPKERMACIFDVMATSDKDIAGSY